MDGSVKFEYIDVVVHRDDGDDDGDVDDSDVLHNSKLVDIISDPSMSLVDATRNCFTSMAGVAVSLRAEGLELADTSL